VARVELDARGVLRPELLPHFRRIAPSGPGIHLARWYWIPQWNFPAGTISRQDVVAYPASNLVVEPDGVTLWGPTSRASRRDLVGRGWAVGALLLPAAVAAFTDDPGEALDDGRPLPAPDLLGDIQAVMDGASDHGAHERSLRALDARADRAARIMEDWLVRRVGEPGEEALRANGVADVLMNDASIRRLPQAADRLGLSPRTLQRLTRRYVGVTPAAMIRRRRVQEAAERVRTEDADLTTIALDLGYADHAHLTRDFTVVLGITPRELRRSRPVAD
jgi:AraC-like DNA-binding protein